MPDPCLDDAVPRDPADTGGPTPTAHPSDAPQRQLGTRSRSGNAMSRTRLALLDAAGRCVATKGVRSTTMGDVARVGGVAKATLYNHFRTKGDLLAALVDAEVARLCAGCVELAGSPGPVRDGLTSALAHAAQALGSSAPLRRVAAEEPATLLPLLSPGPGRGWFQARAAVGDVLVAAGLAADPDPVELVLRWLTGQLLWPLEPGAEPAAAALLVAAVRSAPAGPELRPGLAEVCAPTPDPASASA